MKRFRTPGAAHAAALNFHPGRVGNEVESALLDEPHARPVAHLADREVGS